MIVPMKKVSILVMDKEKEQALDQIRDLGVLHIENKAVSSAVLSELFNKNAHIENAGNILNSFYNKKAAKANKKAEMPKFEGSLTDRVLALSDRRKKLQDYMHNHSREMSRYERWGEFDPGDFAYMDENGIHAFLYEVTFESYENDIGDVPVIVLKRDRKNNNIQLIAFDKIPNHNHWPLPERLLSVVIERNELRKAECSKIEEELQSLSFFQKELENEKIAVMSDIDFETAKVGMDLLEEDEFPVSWITGYIPVPEMDAVKDKAEQNNWAFCSEDPAADDEAVPTKLKNNRLTQFVYPIMGFLDLSPGYRETDVSAVFLIFMTLFFGMIFGDAGYGLVALIILGIAINKTRKNGVPLVVKMLTLFSISAFLWGFFNSAWFGIDIAHLPTFLQNVNIPLIANITELEGADAVAWFNSYNAGNFWIRSGIVAAHPNLDSLAEASNTNFMIFCFTLAMVHLYLARIMAIIKLVKEKSLAVFGIVGQMCLLFGCYFLVLSMIVFNTGFEGVPIWAYMSILVGFVLVFVFGSYVDSILKSILESVKNIISVVLTIPGAFGDITSYIRLWAMGLAGGAIAGTINMFAGPMFGSLALFIFGALLFGGGHVFNMVLNGMAFIVHGVRLNTLEFTSHIGMEWSGFPYKPFAKRSK